MKKALFTLLMSMLALPATMLAQAPDPKAVIDYGQTLKIDGVTLNVILMNDQTIETFFQAPTKYSMKARAKQTTMLYVQGTPQKDLNFKPVFSIEQGGETIAGRPINVKNFQEGKVPKGERIDGILEFPKKVDVSKPFKVVSGSASAEFKLSQDLARAMTPPPAPAP